MLLKKIILMCLLLCSTIIMFTGCSSKKVNWSETDEIDKIKIEMVNKSELPEGNVYGLKLINGSSYLIKQNSVYLSYPIKIEKGSSWNKCKVEATGNKLNIKPNEEVVLSVFIDNVNFKNNDSLDIENPQIEFKCYLNDVTELNHYHKVGDLEFFDKDYNRNQ